MTGCRCEAQPHAPSAPDAASLWYVRLRVPAGQACESRARERTLTAGSLSPLPALMDPEPPCERMQHHDAPDAWPVSRASGGHAHADHLSALQQTCISLRHAAPRCRRRRADHPPGTSRGPRSSEQRAATEEGHGPSRLVRGAYFEIFRLPPTMQVPCAMLVHAQRGSPQGKEQLVRCAMGTRDAVPDGAATRWTLAPSSSTCSARISVSTSGQTADCECSCSASDVS